VKYRHDLMHRILSDWLFGVVDDTARAALMLALAGAALSLGDLAVIGPGLNADRSNRLETVRDVVLFNPRWRRNSLSGTATRNVACGIVRELSEGRMLLTSVLALALLTPAQTQTPASAPAQPQEQNADQKEPPTPAHTGLHALFGDLGEDIKHLPEMQNVLIAAIGGGLALAVHPADQTFNANLQSQYGTVNAVFAPGKFVGDTPEQVALSLGTYAFGRWRDQPKVAHLGMDLLQAQILTEMIVEPLKFSVRRLRPDGSNRQSFPSGHAAITFATATIIERHLGWRKAALGYVIASYVASSRLHDNVHYVSDVVFGAAIGSIAAARWCTTQPTTGRSCRFQFRAAACPDGHTCSLIQVSRGTDVTDAGGGL